MDTTDAHFKITKSSLPTKKVAVLVLNYNGLGFLGDCLKSLERLNYPNYEVILVDNASSDGSVEYVRQNFSWVKIVAHQSNYGPCEGYNRAIQYADGDYLAFLNSDIVVDSNWLAELVRAAEEYQADICGSKILLCGKPQLINYSGAKITPIGVGYCLDFGMPQNQANDRTKPTITGATGGAAMAIKRETFTRLGGFDPDYFWGSEETDLCWRAWLYGYRVIQVPSSIAYHRSGGSWVGRHSPMRIFYGQKNRLANIIKYFGLVNLVKGLAISLVYDMVMIVRLLLRGEFKALAALAKGNFQFIRELPRSLKKRQEVQRNRQISDKKLYQLGLIAPLRECIAEWVRLEKIPLQRGN